MAITPQTFTDVGNQMWPGPARGMQQGGAGQQNPFMQGEAGYNPVGTGAQYNPSKMGTAGPGSGGAGYDLSGMGEGQNKMRQAGKGFNPGSYSGQYSPFQFSTPGYNTVGPQGMTSGLNAVSPGMYNNMYQSAYKSGAQPIMAQSQERMRQMAQGFEGTQGRMSGAANRALTMRNAQATGSDLSGLSNTLSAQQQGQQFGEQQNINQQNYQERLNQQNQTFQENQNQRNFIANAAMQNQQNQSSANFGAAGFNASESNQMAQNQMMQAQQLFGMGSQVPQMQAYLTGTERQAWQNTLNQLGALGGIKM